MQQLIEARNKFYYPDILFGKYRTLAAEATMYEYFQTGRCTSLEGPDGAYNLYESELRANTIISKLDIVIDKLDEIQNSQYTLCGVLKKMNSSLIRISSKLDEACASLSSISNDATVIRDNTDIIANNSAVIAYNTEKTAFYSKMTASISGAMLLGF